MKKEETKKVNNDFDKSFGVINNLVNKEFKNCKSYNDSIKNLETIEKIFKKLNYIPNPDIKRRKVQKKRNRRGKNWINFYCRKCSN